MDSTCEIEKIIDNIADIPIKLPYTAPVLLVFKISEEISGGTFSMNEADGGGFFS